jgi:hypothetical protein
MELTAREVERFAEGFGGWIAYQSERLIEPAYVRLAPHEDGRLVAVELYLTDKGGIDAVLMRSVPLGRIEAWANGPDGESFRKKLDIKGPDLREALGPFGRKRKPLGEVTLIYPDPKLDEVPTTWDKGDDFYRAVAERYAALAQIDRGPAARIAEANGVPATTVRRWVKEARRRGFLSAGRSGKAG